MQVVPQWPAKVRSKRFVLVPFIYFNPSTDVFFWIFAMIEFLKHCLKHTVAFTICTEVRTRIPEDQPAFHLRQATLLPPLAYFPVFLMSYLTIQFRGMLADNNCSLVTCNLG
jgi:hypothetical protein